MYISSAWCWLTSLGANLPVVTLLVHLLTAALWVCGPGKTPGVYQLRYAFLIRRILGEFCIDGEHAFQLRASGTQGAARKGRFNALHFFFAKTRSLGLTLMASLVL